MTPRQWSVSEGESKKDHPFPFNPLSTLPLEQTTGMENKHARCRTCKKVRAISQFYVFKKDGVFSRYDTRCKKCKSEYTHEYRSAKWKNDPAWREHRKAINRKAYLRYIANINADPVRLAEYLAYKKEKNDRERASGYKQEWHRKRLAKRMALVEAQAQNPKIKAILERLRGI